MTSDRLKSVGGTGSGVPTRHFRTQVPESDEKSPKVDFSHQVGRPLARAPLETARTSLLPINGQK